MPIRILLLTQWFDPEPTFKGMAFARELVRQGFEVEVLTGFPNYPGGRVYPGYRIKLRQQETIDGVRITRVPLYPSHDQSALRRVLNYASFSASSFVYGLFIRRPDIIYAYHPPLTVGVSASTIGLLRRIPVVYDIQDMWPDSLRATGMIRSARILNWVGAVCHWVYRRVDRIVVLSPGFKHLLVRRGVPDGKVDVVYNWADEAVLTNPKGHLPVGFPQDDRFRILFAGNLGKAQALDAVLEAARLLQSADSPVTFIMLGGGVEMEGLKHRARDLGLQNVVFFPPVPMAEVGTYLQSADALLVHLRKDPLFRITIPSKTQAYMAVGKPLLMAVDGDAAELITRSGGGIVAESESAEAIANAAKRLATLSSAELAEMGQRARRYYRQHLELQVGVSRFGEIFERAAKVKK